MNTTKITFVLLTLTLIAGLASASPAELTIFPEESSTQINSFTSYEVEVENSGTVKDVYEIQHNYPGEISVAPNTVELEPGQSDTVNVWFNPRQDRDEGRYQFRVTASSRADGQDYSINGYVNVIKDYKVDVDVEPSDAVCRGENARYEVTVTNDGIQTDEIELTTEYGTLSQNRVTLDAGESTEVTVTANSEEAIDRDFNIRASSTSVSYATDTETTQFTSETCYKSGLSVNPESQDVAAFNTAEFEVTVQNEGTREDEFTLSSDVGELSDTTLEVDPKSTETTTLTYTPESVGQTQINVKLDGESSASTTASLESYNGMESEVSFGESQTVCRDENAEFDAEIENTGEASETYTLSTNIGELSETSLELDEGDEEEVEVEVNSSKLEDGEHTVRLESQASTFEEPINSAETSLNVENCWDLEMNVVPEVASAGKNMSTIYEVQLENTGTKENTYRLVTEGPEWIEIRPESITVASGQTGTAYLYAGVPFEKKGEVEITAIAEGTQVRKSETVDLVIGQDIEDAIRRGNGITGRFMESASGLYNNITGATNIQRGLAAILLGVLLTAAILYREW